MRSTARFGIPLVLGALCGCAGTSPQLNEIETGGVQVGILEVGVLGADGEVRFFVDGKRIESAAGGSWWNEVRLVQELPAGEHAVEARFRTERFAGEGAWKVVSREPVVIRARCRTRLSADVRAASTHPPGRGQTFFVVQGPLSSDAPVVIDGQPSTALVPVEVRLAWRDPGLAAELLRGEGPPVPLVTPPPAAARAPDTVAIRRQTAVAGEPGPPQANLAPAGTSDADARAGSPSASLGVGVLVDSQPSGAGVLLDDAYVGLTPLRLRVDPRTDHVLQVEREGCEPRVQLLSSADWKAGRSPRILLELDCR